MRLLCAVQADGLGTRMAEHKRSHRPEEDAVIRFGRFCAVRRTQLLADGRPVAVGSRAFDLLMVLLKARGNVVAKDSSSITSGHRWPSKRAT